ncbi:catalase family peroxidase [uncultured Marinobacter sp.]|uniref:catalase family peroxidase n=1 Tax=uncultured Marinobacter sp. TaxID=187379 RepID=UPI0030D8137D
MIFFRYAAIALVVGGLSALIFMAANGVGQSPVTAQRFVDLQEGGDVHAGFRRAHAKGFCVAGEFISNGSLAALSTAAVFQVASTPFVGRISIAGNNPTAPDLRSPVRSLALAFDNSSAGTWRTAMNTPPVMAVGTPEAFYEQLSVLAPDPVTGQRNSERIQAFFEAHPETAAFRAWQASYTPTQSFATERYHSINAFYLIDQDSNRQAVRWAAVPAALTDLTAVTELADDNSEALQEEFMSRVARQPVVFDLTFTLAAPEDNENDPTTLWPDSRQQLVAGQLVINEVLAEAQGACNDINFDPLVLPAGMAATADPILRARSAAYAESFRRRAREHLLGRNKELTNE